MYPSPNWYVFTSVLFLKMPSIFVGLFSMNVVIPTNNHFGNVYNYFAIIIALAFLIVFTYLLLIRYWWLRAKRRRGPIL